MAPSNSAPPHTRPDTGAGGRTTTIAHSPIPCTSLLIGACYPGRTPRKPSLETALILRAGGNWKEEAGVLTTAGERAGLVQFAFGLALACVDRALQLSLAHARAPVDAQFACLLVELFTGAPARPGFP